MCRFPIQACLFVSSVVVATNSLGQTIFEPARYQFGGQNPFYYGGSDQRVFQAAEVSRSAGGRFGRVSGFAFISGNVHTHREVSSERVRVFSDSFPYQNAVLFGFTPDMARNEANLQQPRHFKMADLIVSNVPPSNRARVVPASTARPRVHVIGRKLEGDAR